MDTTATSTETPKADAQRSEGAPTESPVSLSAKAVEMIKDAIATQKLDGHSLRVGVIPGGCAGFSYDLDLVKEPRPGDLRFEYQGVGIIMDPVSVPYLKGTQIDYVVDGMRAGFAFKNPNAKSSCGCGSSFQA